MKAMHWEYRVVYMPSFSVRMLRVQAAPPPPRKRVSPGTNNSPGRPFLRKCNRIIFLLYNLHQQICLKILYLVNLTNGECYCSSFL